MSRKRQRYPTDLSEREWKLIEPFMPKPANDGRHMKYEWREILNGIFYVMRSGCSWRMMPNDLPDWQSSYGYFRKWSKDGTWEHINKNLNMEWRLRHNKEALPSIGIIDSQSVKTTEKGG